MKRFVDERLNSLFTFVTGGFHRDYISVVETLYSLDTSCAQSHNLPKIKSEKKVESPTWKKY